VPAFLLYGIALTYGATGSTDLVEIRRFFDGRILVENGLLMAGLAMLLVGFGFKVAAAPFHAWTPDVYQGAPTPVVAYMAATVKAAGFAAVVRIFVVTLEPVAAMLVATTPRSDVVPALRTAVGVVAFVIAAAGVAAMTVELTRPSASGMFARLQSVFGRSGPGTMLAATARWLVLQVEPFADRRSTDQ